MKPFEIRWQNFRSFEDTNKVRIRPLTIVIGPNGCGKTSLLAPLLILRQTLESSDRAQALITHSDLFDAGGFTDVVRDRDASKRISLAFHFATNAPSTESKSSDTTMPRPSQIELTFALNDPRAFPVLYEYKVSDSLGKQILMRRLGANDKYSLSKQFSDDIDPRLLAAIKNSPPNWFLFKPDAVFSVLFDLATKTTQSKTSKLDATDDSVDMALKGSAARYFGITTTMSIQMESLLNRITFVGPLRDHPRRVYLLSGDHPPHVGTRGEYAPEIIFRARDSGQVDRVNDWIMKFGFGLKLEACPCGEDAFSIKLQQSEGGPKLNLADTGFGLSQVLPLIVQSYYSDTNTILIAEQPEIHLNPRLQTVLADLFCEVANSGRGVIIETHSEHLLLRLRRLVADGTIKHSDVSLLYVESEHGKSTVREIEIQGNGHIGSGEWPKGFFEDSLRESLSLATVQSRMSRSAG